MDWKAFFCELLHNAWKKYTSAPYLGDPVAFEKAKSCVELASELGCVWAAFGADLSSPGGDLSDPEPLVPPKPCHYVADPAIGTIIRDPVGFSSGRC